jgi:hypothetical protein
MRHIITCHKDNRRWFLPAYPLASTRARLRHVRLNNKKRANSYWTAAVYLVDRVYGGHEEGGWWYNTSELVTDRHVPLPSYHHTNKEACIAANKMQLWCLQENDDRPSINSVLSEGIYEALVHRNSLPPYLPRKRPYYS